MSKSRRGNKEAKKPKRARPAAAPILPQESVAGSSGVSATPLRKK
jgi:hypothetical protein